MSVTKLTENKLLKSNNCKKAEKKKLLLPPQAMVKKINEKNHTQPGEKGLLNLFSGVTQV